MFNIPSQNPIAQIEIDEEFPHHSKDIQAPIVSSEVNVLIGANASDVFQPLELRKETQDQTHSMKTPLR